MNAQKTLTGLPEKISLAWLNSLTLSFITIAINLFLLRTTINSAVDQAELEVNSTCNAVNTAATKLDNIPEILQNQAILAIKLAVADAQKMFLNIFNVIQGILVWCIDFYKGTFRCLILLAVNGLLSAAVSITGLLQEAVQDLSGQVSSIVNSIGSLFGHPDTITMPNLQLNWTGPVQNAQQVVQNYTSSPDILDQMIGELFDIPRGLINQSFASWQVNLPNATIQQKTPCNITDVYDGIEKVRFGLMLPLWIAIGAIMGLFVIVSLYNVWSVFRRYRAWQIYRRENASYLVTVTENPHSVEEVEDRLRWYELRLQKRVVHYLIGPPANGKTKSGVLGWIQDSSRVGWWIDYLTHPFALYCLCLGALGVICIYTLLGVMDFVKNDLLVDVNQLMNDWAGNITTAIDNSTAGDINTINQAILNSQNDLNNNVLGVVRSGATQVEQVLQNVENDITGFLNSTLGNTFLESFIEGVLNCILFNKINDIDNALNWVATNFYVTFTTIDPTLIPTDFAQDFVSDLTNSTVFNTMYGHVRSSLSDQLYYYWILLGLWGLCFLFAIGFSIYAACKSSSSNENMGRTTMYVPEDEKHHSYYASSLNSEKIPNYPSSYMNEASPVDQKDYHLGQGSRHTPHYYSDEDTLPGDPNGNPKPSASNSYNSPAFPTANTAPNRGFFSNVLGKMGLGRSQATGRPSGAGERHVRQSNHSFDSDYTTDSE